MVRKFSHIDHKNPWEDSDVEAHWDRVAPVYVRENEKVKDAHDQRFTHGIRHLHLSEDAFVLNITSRDCEAVDYILSQQSKAKVVNAEISKGLMDVARKLRPYADQVKLSTYSELPFDDHTFNRVLSLETIEHVADPVAFLKELYRISTVDARMVLSCPPSSSEIPYRIYTFIFGGHGEGPHRFLHSSEVKDMLRKTGWKLLLHQGTVLFPVGPALIRKWGEKIMKKKQGTFISELGIRQFYICEKH